MLRLLVVVRDFDVIGAAILPPETDPILIVDAHAPLADAVAPKSLEPVAGRPAQILQVAHALQLIELALGYRPDDRRAPGACRS